MQNDTKKLILAALYFLLSTIITAWFICEKSNLYESRNEMLLSGIIAGTKWAVQLLAAFLFLGRKRFEFVKQIGLVCFIGSILLFTTYLLSLFPIADFRLFVFALLWSVVVMITLYYRAVRLAGVSIRWFYGWLTCLLIAISMQLTIVFRVF